VQTEQIKREGQIRGYSRNKWADRREGNMKESSEFTKEEIKRLENEIENMSQMNMARRWRFAKSGDPMFRSDLPLVEKFKKRFFDELGGFTPEISKAIDGNRAFEDLE